MREYMNTFIILGAIALLVGLSVLISGFFLLLLF